MLFGRINFVWDYFDLLQSRDALWKVVFHHTIVRLLLVSQALHRLHKSLEAVFQPSFMFVTVLNAVISIL